MYQLKSLTKQNEWNFITHYSYTNIRHWAEREANLDLEAFDQNINMLHRFWKEKCEVKILVAEEDPNVFLGFIVWQHIDDKTCNLWFLAIKETFRSVGLGTLLAGQVEQYEKIRYYFHTHSLKKIMNQLPKKRKKEIRPETQEFFNKLVFRDIFNGFLDLS